MRVGMIHWHWVSNGQVTGAALVHRVDNGRISLNPTADPREDWRCTWIKSVYIKEKTISSRNTILIWFRHINLFQAQVGRPTGSDFEPSCLPQMRTAVRVTASTDSQHQTTTSHGKHRRQTEFNAVCKIQVKSVNRIMDVWCVVLLFRVWSYSNSRGWEGTVKVYIYTWSNVNT